MGDYYSDVIIEFDNVFKQYPLYKSERERFFSAFRKNKNTKYHTALKDVSFKVAKGESIAIIGNNGAGKSTLLKMITKVTFPTSGSVEVVGRVSALLELTAGFSMDMTGRENIFLKGSILGIEKENIKRIEQSIVEFADLGDYLDQPVKTYSSGMRMRLGFAINININPDILVIDEALSVGDANFKKKCKAKIQSLLQQGITVIYVSHSENSVKELCSRAIYLKKGEIVFDGNVDEALKQYKKKS